MGKNTVPHSGLEHLNKAGVKLNDDQTDIQTVAESDLAKLAADEEFMQEHITVRIAPSINPNDAPYAVITVCTQGKTERAVIPRGQAVIVKRKHLEVLARLKQVSYYQKPASSVDLETGNQLYANVGLVYPFEVVKDANDKGRAWLDNILSEPV